MTVGSTHPSTRGFGRYVGRVLALTLAAGALATTQLTGTAYAVDAVTGAQTAGDSLFPNQGNGGYDVSHYDIAFKIDVTIATTNNAASTTNLPDATATIDATTTGAPLSSYSFDFQGTSTTLAASTLNVDSVTVDGVPATFERIENTTIPDATTDKHKLVVTPATPVSGTFTTVVKYSGQPVVHRDTDNSIEGWNNTVDGATFVNQPVGSMTLFPNNNTPRDKATYTWTVDAPTTLRTSNLAQAGGKSYQAGVASNGELLSRTANGDGTRTTWVWDQQAQQASELSFFSIGRYDIYTSDIALASGRTIPEWTFIDPALSVANQTATLGARAQLKSLLDFFESKYGPYPGNSTGVVTDNTTGIDYALETQDRPFFPNSTGTTSRSTFYHEIMHQWWGNNVSPTDWNDITLSEGPAQYAEYQFPFEGAGSTTTTTEQAVYNSYTATLQPGDTRYTVAPAAMTDAGDLFGEQVYAKGAMALEALRTSIGATDFETLMRQYQLTYGGGQITGRRTAAFQAMAESISGRDLSAFFQTWWFTSGKPAWPVKFDLNVAGPSAQVNPGDPVTYTLSARNTGKLTMPAGGTLITLDIADVTDDATIGALPANVTLSGTTLTWAVPQNPLVATTSVAIPFTVNADTVGNTLKPVARASTLGGTCVDCSPSLTVGTAPISPAPVPTITGGVPTIGTPLTADAGTWAEGTTFAYQWFTGGSPVPGATAATYTPTVETWGTLVSVKVTGTLAGFNKTTQTSANTLGVIRGTQPVATPTISGTPKIGSRLTVAPGTWQPGTVFTYQWRANNSTISGATGPSYIPAVSTQTGQAISVVVTGTKAGYDSVARISGNTAAVGAGDPLVNTPLPTLPATAAVGAAMTAVPGDWDDRVVLTYTWQRNGTNIAGATAVAYTPVAADLDQALTVTVVGTKPGVTGVSRVSVPVTPAAGTQVRQPTPTITAEPHAGVSVNGGTGTWDTGTTLSYRWLVDGVAEAGATTIAYSPTVDQIGKDLTFEVTSTRAGYTTVVNASVPSAIGPQVQNFKPTPTVAGSGKVGTDLTATDGTWDTDTAQAYQWSVDGTAVDGATGLTYTVKAADLGKPVTFTVTSTKPTYETITRTSAPTTATAGDLTSTPVPTITGTPKVGGQLTAVPGDWDADTELSYQWQSDGAELDGVTAATYTPDPGDVGGEFSVVVTGTKAGYTTVSRASEPTDPVAQGDLDSTPVPTITGTPKVGVTLAAVPGDWDAGTDLAYQWLADDEVVDGATDATYTPGAGKVGAEVTVKVTGTKAGYETVTKTSEPTDPIAKGNLDSTPVPTITGTPKVDVTLTAVPGDWDPDAELAYQWFADDEVVDGATGTTYTPGAGKVGAAITVAVTGTRDAYEAVTRTSEPTAAVVEGDLDGTPVPTISGVAKVDVTLTAVPGDWDPDAELAYQWFADGEAVDGATGTTYTPGAGKVGDEVTVKVTGTKSGYDAVTRTSEPTDPVAAGDLTATPVPAISGTPQVDVTLTAVPGDWDAGTDLAYQWFADGEVVDGVTGTTYTPGAGKVGTEITVKVTGAKAGYEAVTKTSEPTELVAKGDLDSTPVPTISGTPQVDVTLTAVPGDWDAGTDLAYQWLADGEVVDGVTGTSYTPGAGKVGTEIAVKVTGTKAGYETVTKTSEPTEAVAQGDLSNTPTPTVTGTAKVDHTLTAVPGVWDGGATLTRQWFADGDPIDGATGATFDLDPAQAGALITVKVTGTKTGYSTVTRTSSSVGPVAQGDLTSTPTPTITGTPQVGHSLTAAPGTWDDGVALTYQWFADGEPISGASAAVLEVTPALQGAVVTVAVSGAKSGYDSVTKTSAATDEVAVGELTSTPVPTITGTPKVAVALTAHPGTWDDGASLAYQWSTDGNAVDGATLATYTPGAARLGAVVTVTVTGTKAGYTTVTKTSQATAPVAAGDQVSTSVPTITGTPKVAVALTAHRGTWDDGTTLGYQWFTDGSAVDGATDATYTPGAGKLGAVVTVKVTGTRTGFETVTKTSAPTAAVAAGDQTATPTPTIAGATKVGGTLTAVPGTWDDGATFTYAWFAGAEPIAGATGATYVVSLAELGKALRVEMTGTKAGYTSVTRSSALTGTVGPGDQVLTPTPAITGAAKVGTVLRAVTGTWGDGVTLSYQWLRGDTAIPGATDGSYALVAGDLGAKIALRVTGAATGYTDASTVSLPTAAVARGTLASHPKPRVQGVAKVGRTLKVRPVAWEAGVKLSYRWYAGSKAIGGATKATFKVKKALAGKKLRVVVTATKPGYTTVTKSSGSTGKVKS